MSYTIEKGVPMPEPRGRKPGSHAETMKKMAVGDSFVFEGTKLGSMQSVVRMAASRLGIVITTRQEIIENDPTPEVVKLRVWKTGDAK